MLLKEISVREFEAMDRYRREYAYDDSSCYNRQPMEYILRYWNKNKATLFKAFGNKLVVSKAVCIKVPKSCLEDEMSRIVAESSFCDWLFDLGRTCNFNWEERHIICDLIACDTLAENKYTGQSIKLTFNEKLIDIPNGCKPLRIISKIAHIYGKDAEFEQFRINHSMVLNKKDLHGELVLSIHPLDYMTMSDNASNWSSCMSWEDHGCYRRGTVEMMNSPMAVVAYLKGEKDMVLPCGMEWNNKKWRNLILFQEDFITSVKSYPYQSSELSTLAVEMLTELAETNLGLHYNEVIKYRPFEEFALDEDENGDGIELYRFDYETEAMYNDFESGLLSYMAMRKGLEPGRYDTYYSGPGVCMHCGEIRDFYDYDESEGVLVCSECNPRYYCAECGDRIYEDDGVYEVDGSKLCYHCYENCTVETADDEDYHLETNTENIFVVGSKEGLDYTANSIRVYCANCPDTIFMKTNFTIDRFHITESGYRRMYYVLVDELTNDGLELFDLAGDEEALAEYKIEYSLSRNDRLERRRRLEKGLCWPPSPEEEAAERECNEAMFQKLRAAILAQFANETGGLEIRF